MKEIQVIEKQQNQSLQKQVKDLQTANTTLQEERDNVMEELEVMITAAPYLLLHD